MGVFPGRDTGCAESGSFPGHDELVCVLLDYSCINSA